MAEVNASNPSIRPDLSAGMARSKNTRPLLQNQFGREAEYHIYVYSVSDYEHKIEKPWFHGTKILKGKKSGEDYTVVMSIPHPLMLPKEDFNSNTIDFVPTSGMAIVNDILNPDNDISGSNNLARRGVFYSMTNPPKPEEVKAAVGKMETHFRGLLEKARVLELSNPKELNELLTAEYHQAAEYFGEENLSWHKKQTRPVACPNCGESIKAGIAFHRDASGDLCILDWGRALKAGKATREQAYAATNDKQFAPQVETAKPTSTTAI